jgi:hypothetical protein
MIEPRAMTALSNIRTTFTALQMLQRCQGAGSQETKKTKSVNNNPVFADRPDMCKQEEEEEITEEAHISSGHFYRKIKLLHTSC